MRSCEGIHGKETDLGQERSQTSSRGKINGK
jgi:hypothetical protein